MLIIFGEVELVVNLFMYHVHLLLNICFNKKLFILNNLFSSLMAFDCIKFLLIIHIDIEIACHLSLRARTA